MAGDLRFGIVIIILPAVRATASRGKGTDQPRRTPCKNTTGYLAEAAEFDEVSLLPACQAGRSPAAPNQPPAD